MWRARLIVAVVALGVVAPHIMLSRQARDLSQPHWDAWFALMPDGKSILLSNGRGGLWRADVIYNK
jgi:hypothetical protein